MTAHKYEALTMDQLKEARKLLDNASWTRNVSREALDGLLEHAKYRSHSRKSYIFRLGDPSSSFYGLLSGQVRLSIPAESGDEFITVSYTHLTLPTILRV